MKHTERRLDTRLKPRRSIALILGSVAGFGLWASFAPLDAGETAEGVVRASLLRQTIQATRSGRVSELAVQEGQPVKRGQRLLRLDGQNIDARLSMTRTRLIRALAERDRLRAESIEANTIDFDPRLSGIWHKEAAPMVALQQGRFATRRRAELNESVLLEETREGLRQQLAGQQALLSARQQERHSLQSELTELAALAAQGYFPKLTVAARQRQLALLEGQLAETRAGLGRLRSGLAEQHYRYQQKRLQQRNEQEARLTSVSSEVDELEARLIQETHEAGLLEHVAPLEGVVAGLALHGTGAIVSEGQTLMEIVPVRDTLLVEVRLAAHRIDKVHPGLAVETRFPALAQATTPTVAGVVDTVGADTQTDPRTGQAYFLVKVRLTPDPRTLQPIRDLRPGMPAVAMIKTGERTLLQYWMKPLQDRLQGALKEK